MDSTKNFHRQRVKLSHNAIGVPTINRVAQTTSASRSVKKIALQSIAVYCGADMLLWCAAARSLGIEKPYRSISATVARCLRNFRKRFASSLLRDDFRITAAWMIGG